MIPTLTVLWPDSLVEPDVPADEDLPMNQAIKLKRVAVAVSLISGVFTAPIATAERDANVPNGPYHSYKHNQHYNNQERCTPYRLSAYGGEAGFRLMNNVKIFKRTAHGSVAGRICSGGRVTVELSKTNPNTHVALQVNGREYVFGQGDRGERLTNHWFRRYIQIDLASEPRHNYSQKNDRHDPRGYDNHYREPEYSDDHDNEFAQHDNRHRQNQRPLNHNYYDGHKSRRNHTLPHLRLGSKKHHKAHRKGIAHSHQKEFYAYH